MSKAHYTFGSIEGTMLKTGAAMLPATVSFIGYNVADTFFVSRLGTRPLAAMGFTFPMIMLIGCVNRGLATGAATTLAHALGAGKRARAARIAGAGFTLAVGWSVAMGLIGYSTIGRTFRLFGAGDEVLPLIHLYMGVWYLGCAFAALSAAGNSVLIAAGHSRSASFIMMGSMLFNVVLDPILIFGWGIVPALGIQGAAIATVLSHALAAAASLYVLRRKVRLLQFDVFTAGSPRDVWGLIMRMAVPSIIGMLMMPVGNGVTTRVTAVFGDAAVAACAAAGRLELTAFVVPMALGISLTPIVAQNYGAKQSDRIERCRRFALGFAFELVVAILFFIAAPSVSGLFSDNPRVIDVMTLYLRIIPWGFGLMEIHRYGGFFFTGCDRPKMAACLNALRIFALLIPLSLLALWLHSLPGLFAARLAADSLAGFACVVMTKRLIGTLSE